MDLTPFTPNAMSTFRRPDRKQYYMNLALAVRERANCRGSRVGAVLVLEDRVISTGYNGVPQEMTNCDEGGCERCANRGAKFPSGTAYDICICVHAEQNALLTAARFGIGVQDAILYSTMKPCFGCAKELLQAHVKEVYYLHEWTPKPELETEYKKILGAFERVERIDIHDQHAEWARGGERKLSA